ncbi:hypothetical protein [Methylobacterium sp. 1973]|uniref:hypothetical protein n=1 Tax=Methylobacterium sp. 1973 TaxID=3156421 RepID=UPI0033960020
MSMSGDIVLFHAVNALKKAGYDIRPSEQDPRLWRIGDGRELADSEVISFAYARGLIKKNRF